MPTTRIESKSRAAKRWQGRATWDISDEAFVLITGKVMRRNRRGFPNRRSVDTTAVRLTEQA
jgi:hypothetical protein